MPKLSKHRLPADKEKVRSVKAKLATYVEKNDISDPRKQAFLEAYFIPSSPSYSNAYQSALRAGFAPSYANQITSTAKPWIQDFRRSLQERIVNTAERRGLELLEGGNAKVSADMVKFFLPALDKETYAPKSSQEIQHLIKHEMDDDQVTRILTRMKIQVENTEKNDSNTEKTEEI